jgi:hypothetical protein
MSTNDTKASLNTLISGTGVFATFSVSDETKLRLVISDSTGSNSIIVKARIVGQTDWDTLTTIIGDSKQAINISTYDIVELECTSFGSTSSYVRVIASSFNEAGVSTAIDGTSGTRIEDAELLTFTSTDGSVEIVTDNVNKTIDLIATGGGGTAKYTTAFTLSNWIGPSAGEYFLDIPFSQHAKVNPVVTTYEDIAGELNKVETPVIVYTNNNIRIVTLSSPDTRFAGKIFIE